jgi:hypothetical protein
MALYFSAFLPFLGTVQVSICFAADAACGKKAAVGSSPATRETLIARRHNFQLSEHETPRRAEFFTPT